MKDINDNYVESSSVSTRNPDYPYPFSERVDADEKNGLDFTNIVMKKDDPVNHPSHYTAGGIECIDAITAAISCQGDPVNAWLTAQCLKYLWRWPLKNGLEDLKKTRFYLDRLIARLEEEEEGK